MVGIGGIFLFFVYNISDIDISNESCVYERRVYEVRGESMSPLLTEGQDITGLLGYYACHEITRGDMVLYAHPGRENFLMKVAVGIPGDAFMLKKSEDALEWNIVINEKVVKNSAGVAYALDEQKHKILSFYERDYAGKIPEGAYLLLGDVPSGSFDSTQFGLVGKNKFVGKVEMP